MKQTKYLFIDRDGTLIIEPEDEQVDSIAKLDFMPGVFSSLEQLQQAGYQLVIVTNQDGLGTEAFPHDSFIQPHELMLNVFKSQGIEFADIKVCPHLANDLCDCRKPKPGLLLDYLTSQTIDRKNSFVIGDRLTDLQLADNLGINGIQIGTSPNNTWPDVSAYILNRPRQATIVRETKETSVSVSLNLDQINTIQVNTGIRFFDHMLEQLIKHAGISATIMVKGDTDIDDHHTVEDTAIVLGQALKEALADKRGIARYGFTLPMDESLATVALDLSGRAYCQFNGEFKRAQAGDLATEMVPHFVRSLADSLSASVHVSVQGKNTHHMVEAIFKGLGRVLRQAIAKDNQDLPTTKGVL